MTLPVLTRVEDAVAPPLHPSRSDGHFAAFLEQFEARLFERLDGFKEELLLAATDSGVRAGIVSRNANKSTTHAGTSSSSRSWAEKRAPSQVSTVSWKKEPFEEVTPVSPVPLEKTVTEEELEFMRHEIEGDGMTEISNSRLREYARRIVNSRFMKHIVTVLIIGNAGSIGAQVNWAVQHPRQHTPDYFDSIEIGFLIVFALELVLRLMAEARHFFACENKHVYWNILDFILVTHGFCDVIMESIWRDTLDVGVMRLVRIARLIRVVRVIRVMRFFRDLRIMIIGIVSTLRSLMWAVLLLVIIIYIVSIVVMEFISSELDVSDANSPVAAALQEQFGSLFDTMFLLFQCISGGVDWDSVSSPLFRISSMLGFFYTAYVAFSLFCVLNVITGVFVENSAKISLKDEENLLLETIESRRQRTTELSSLFEVLSEGNITFNRRQFQRFSSDIRVQARFGKLGISTYCMSGLFNLLDFQRNGNVTFDNFSMGIEMLHGSAKSIDLARLRSEVKALAFDIRTVRSSVTGSPHVSEPMTPDSIHDMEPRTP
eukprot:TRINITY_DN26742_c0_g2_i1.p1 TRINITY_DN26742_c0_g2~~TRINITY_DN26742_c0_g2_i1.p1  ORF type:complete len:545 (-),score=56.08 TRINITY_DN26742_c0_g2_i1:119-1753(-)